MIGKVILIGAAAGTVLGMLPTTHADIRPPLQPIVPAIQPQQEIPVVMPAPTEVKSIPPLQPSDWCADKPAIIHCGILVT